MTDEKRARLGQKGFDALKARVDHLVGAGRVTEQEAADLRCAADAEDAEATLRAISVRHASAKLDAAVAAGTLGRDDADALVDRMRAGEHSPAFRAHLRERLSQEPPSA